MAKHCASWHATGGTTLKALPASRRTLRCVCVEENAGEVRWAAQATGQVVSDLRCRQPCRREGCLPSSSRAWRAAKTLAADVRFCAVEIGRHWGSCGRGGRREERGGVVQRRRAGPGAYAIGTWMLLALMLFLSGTPGVFAINIFLSDAVERPIGGVVTVPQGPLVLLHFTGSYRGEKEIQAGDAISIVRGDESCRVRAHLDAAPKGVSNVILDANGRAFFDFTAVTPSVGYQLCVCPGTAMVYEDGGVRACPDDVAFRQDESFTVQSTLQGINLKGLSGGTLTIPLQECGEACPSTHTLTDVRYESPKAILAKVSVVKADLKCSLDVENTIAAGEKTSGHLVVNPPPSRLINNFDRLSALSSGTYKMCMVAQGAGAPWEETGVVLTLQRSVASLSINGISEIAAFIAMRAGNKVALCKNHDCTGKFQPPASAPRMASLIPLDASCRETTEKNPATRPRAGNIRVSGHIAVSAADGSLAQAALDTLLLASGPGILQLCLKEDNAVGFLPTGLTLQIQDELLGLNVNGLTPRKWWHVSGPKSAGTFLEYVNNKAGTPGETIALIRPQGLCSSLCRTRSREVCSNIATEQERSVSGFWSAHGTDKVLSSDECMNTEQTFTYACSERATRRSVAMQVLPVGRYKACFRKAATCAYYTCWFEWQGTGVQVDVQDLVTGLNINGAGGAINTAQGQRAVIPRKPFHTLHYLGSWSAGGKLKILGKSDDCSDFSATSTGMPLASNEISQASPNVEMAGEIVDRFFDMSVGLYQVCFLAKGNVTFVGTGVSITVQNDVEGLEVNGITPNRGLRIAMPKRKSSRLRFFRGSLQMSIGDKISLIRLQDHCYDPSHNPQTSAPSNSGYMVVEALPLIGDAGYKVLAGSDRIALMDPGVYKVCFHNVYAPAGTVLNTYFRETGLTVTIQNHLTFAIINVRDPAKVKTEWDSAAVSPNNMGVRLTVPKSDNVLFSLFTPGTISFIEPEKDCTSTGVGGENPSVYGPSDDPMYIPAETIYFSSNIHYFLQTYTLNAAVGTYGGRPAGMYQVCFAAAGGSEFFATGISMHLQQELVQMKVNYVTPNAGLRTALPKSKKNIIDFAGTPKEPTTNSAGEVTKVTKLYSFVQVGAECTLVSDNTVSQTSETSGYMRSIDVSPSRFLIPVAQSDRMQAQALGLYQVCYRSNEIEGTVFRDTGLTVVIQDSLFRLKVNLIPKIQNVIPKVENNEVFFCTDEACSNLQPGRTSPSAFISFILPEAECEDTVNYNSASGITGRSGHIPTVRGRLRQARQAMAVAPDTTASLDASLFAGGTLFVGMYQVCIGETDGTRLVFKTTGLSLSVQEYLTGLLINGVTPGFGLNVAIPKSAVSPAMAFAGPLLGANTDQLSLIPAELDCEDTSHNPQLAHATASGYLGSNGLTKILSGTQTILGLRPGIYQACFKENSGSNFKTTGVSASLQTWASGLVQGPGQPPSLQATVTKTTAATLSFIGERMNSTLAPWPPLKASIIGSAMSCTSNATNPMTAGHSYSGHLSVSAGSSPNSFDVNLPSGIHTSVVLAELLYQFCVQIDSQWYSTGLSIQVEWESNKNARAINFDFVLSQESSSLSGSSNAVHVLMRTPEILPPGGILRIEGLKGSQVEDSPHFKVEGNSVEEVSLELTCAGNSTCQITTPANYVESGKILMRAELTIDLACTDLDSTCTKCPEGKADCSEGITAASLRSDSLVRDITSQILPGPWTGCVKKCSEFRTIITGHDILDLCTKSGKQVSISLTAADATSYYTCDYQGTPVTLMAHVTLRMLVSTLSKSLLLGSFSSTSGRLTVQHVPFDTNNHYIHITFILRNSLRLSPARTPTAAILAVEGDGVMVRSKAATIVPRSKAGILAADQVAQFVSASIEMTSEYTEEMNRLTVRLASLWPAVIPAQVAITVAGLVGSSTIDNPRLPLLDPDAVEFKQFECVGSKHCIVNINAKPSDGELIFYRATMDIDIFCSDFASYPSKYIQKMSACSQVLGQAQCPPLDLLTIDEAAYSRGPWQECSGCSASTRSVLKDYDLTKIIGRFDTLGLKKFALEIFASSDVGDLKCYLSPGEDFVRAVKARISVRIEYTQASARWVRSTGSLVVSLSPAISRCGSKDALTCLPDVFFSFEVKNPSIANKGPVTPQVSAHGGGLVFNAVDLHPIFHIVGPRLEIRVLTATIKETTSVKGNLLRGQGFNTLSLTIKFGSRLAGGTIVTVSGLTGTQTSSIACTLVQDPVCGGGHCIYSPAASCRHGIELRGYLMGSSMGAAWDQASGTLRFMVTKSFAQSNYLEFSFDVFNAAAAQAARTATISGSGNGYVIPPTPAQGLVLTSDLDATSVQPQQPRVVQAQIRENNKIEFQTNSMVAEVRLNVPLPAGSKFEISKLDNTALIPAVGSGWYTDVLPNVESIPITDLSDHRFRAQGLFTNTDSYYMPWLCRSGGWGVELDPFYPDGQSAALCQNKRIAAEGVLPFECAVFYQKRWCSVQPKYSVATFVDRCIRANEAISFSFSVSNGAIPADNIQMAPVLTVDGGSVTVSSSFLTSKQSTFREKECKGFLSCYTSFVQDNRFLNSERRFLPPFAVLNKASLSIDLACSSFSDPDQFLQRISMCHLPNCKALYGSSYDWNQVANQCCSNVACQPYVCADRVPIPPSATRAFNVGPWMGCQGNCSESRVVMDLYDMMPVICAGQTGCRNPKSFSIFMSATGAADKFACSGSGARSLFLVATVRLQLEVSYDSAAFASEPVRLDAVKVTQSTEAMQALSKFTIVVDSMVTFPANSEVVITGLKGSMTDDDAQLVLTHSACGISSMLKESIRVPCPYPSSTKFKSWNKKEGELRLTLLREIAAVGDNLQFAFVLRNADDEQDAQVAALKVSLGGPDGAVLGPTIASQRVMSSSDQSKVVQGNLFESNQVARSLNRITISFRTNYHLFRGDNVTVYGLLNSLTESTTELAVLIDGQTLKGRWDQHKGALQWQLASFYDPNESVIFSFVLQNPRTPQGDGLITIEVPSATPAWDQVITYQLSSKSFKASGVLDFREASLKQQNALADQLNRFECSFTPSEDLAIGSIILLSGLKGSQTKSNLQLPIEVVDASGVSVAYSAEWDREAGSLTFAQQSPLSAGTPYRFFFHLLNPKVKEPKKIALLSVYYGLTNLAKREVGAVLDGSESAAFVDARIAEATRTPSALNILTIVFKLNIDLVPTTHEIRVMGMLEARDGSSLIVEGPSAVDFDDDIPFGSQTLVLTPTRVLLSNELYTLNWALSNPEAPQPAPDISVALYNKLTHTYDIAPTHLQGSVLSATLDGQVLAAVIKESSTTQGAKNLVTVQLKIDFPLSYQTRMTLSGFTGTPIFAASLQIHGESSRPFRDSEAGTSEGSWTQSTGTLVLTILSRTIIDAQTNIVFNFELVNPGVARSSTKVQRVSLDSHAATGLDFDQVVLLAATPPAFNTAMLAESSAVAGVLNTITVTFTVNSELNNGAKVTLQGLVDYTGSVTVQNAVFESYSNKQLVVILQAPAPAYSTVSFSFEMFNPAAAGSALKPQILASTIDASGGLVSFPASEMVGSILSAAEPPQFVVTEIRESSKIQSTPNRLSITLVANCLTEASTEITITNLRGSQTPSTSCLSVTSYPAGTLLSCGKWTNDQTGGGTLVVKVGSSNIQPNSSIVFSFSLTNPGSPQDGVIPVVSANNGVRETALVPSSVEWHDGVKVWRGDQQPGTVVGTVLTAALSHVWLSGSVMESSAIAGQDNSLLIEMQANTALPAGSSITVAGLTGTTSQDTQLFTIMGDNGKDTKLGQWTQIIGQLVFELKNEIPDATTLSFIVPLTNPEAAQSAVRPVVSLSYDTAFGESWKIAPITTALRGGASKCCLAADDQPRFSLATVRESSSVKNALNVLDFTFHTNVAMTTGTMVTIAGLKGSQTADNDYIVLMNSTSHSARWLRDGLLVFSVEQAMYSCECIQLCTQNSLAVNLQLRNAASPQPQPAVTVSAQRGGPNGITIQGTAVSGSVLRASTDPALFASVSESSKVSGENNNITIQMLVNSDLDICAAKWLPQNPAWISASQSLIISPVGGVSPDPVATLEKLFDGLTDTSVSILQNHVAAEKVDIIYDFGEAYRLEALSVTSGMLRSSLSRLKFQFADSLTASESEWDTNTAAVMTIGLSLAPKTSPRFDHHARYWRIRMLDNVDPIQFPKSTSLSEVKFFGCPDAATATIRVSNITSAYGPVKMYALQTGLGALRAYGMQVGPHVSIKVSKSIRAYQEISLTFTTRNAPKAQDPKLAGVSVDAELYKIAPTYAYGSMLTSHEAPQFIIKTISEDNDLQSDLNKLTITLMANVDMVAGDNIRIIFEEGHMENNLARNKLPPTCMVSSDPCVVGNDLFASPLPPADQKVSWYTKTNVAALGYTDRKPSVIAILQRTVPKLTEIRFQMVVKNPSQAQMTGMVPEVVASGIAQSSMVERILQAPRAGPSFVKRLISHSSNMAGSRNLITVSLEPGPGVELAAGTQISICGLRGTDSDALNPAAFPKTKTFLSRVSNGFELKADYTLHKMPPEDNVAPAYTGELWACIQFQLETGPWVSGSIASVAFYFKNPTMLLQSAPRLTVVATQKVTIQLPMCKEMNPATGLCKQESDALWTKRKAGFVALKMEQDNHAVKQRSTFSVTLTPNVLVAGRTTLTISGLSGLDPGQNAAIDIKGPISHLIRVDSWAPETGELRLFARDVWNTVASPHVEFLFTVINPQNTQADHEVKNCAEFAVPEEGFTDLGDSGGSGQNILDASCSDPLTLGTMRVNEEVMFVKRDIQESSHVENQDNLITLEFSSNFEMLPGSVLTIVGLTGSQTPDALAMPLLSSYHEGSQQIDTAIEWRQSNGMLKLALKDKLNIWPGRFICSFVLRNPTRAAATTNAMNAATAKALLTVQNVGASSFVLLEMSGTVMHAPDNAKFTSFDVHEQTTVMNQLNTISITLISNVGISKGGFLTIRGLVGRDEEQIAGLSGGICNANEETDFNTTLTLSPIQVFFKADYDSDLVKMSTQHSIIVNSKACLQVDSTIMVEVPRFVKPGSGLVLRFRVTNSRKKLPGCRPSASYSGCRTLLDVHGDLSCTGFGTACSECSAIDMTTLSPIYGNNRLLTSDIPPQIWKAFVGEYTAVLSQPNAITVTLAINIELTPGAIITIDGFQDSQSLPQSSLSVTGPSAPAFGSAARWLQTEGMLQLTANRLIAINETLVFTFELINRGVQDKATCRYGTAYCSGAGGYNEGKACPKLGATCSGACDNGRPACTAMTIRGSCASFTPAELQDPVKKEEADGLCVGGACAAPNNGYQCPGDALVNTSSKTRVQGLLIDPAVDKVRIVYMGQSAIIKGQDCSGDGISCKGQSMCVPPNEGAHCTRHIQCTGAYDPSLKDTPQNHAKRSGAQRCVRLPRTGSIGAGVKADRANLTRTLFQGSILGFVSPTPPEFTTRSLSESSSVAGAANVLTISLSANFRLYDVRDTNITLVGLPLHTYGIQARVPILPANQQTLISVSDCDLTGSVVTCDKIGHGLRSDPSFLLLTAMVNIELTCYKGSAELCQGTGSLQGASTVNGSCFLINAVRMGDGNASLPVGSYSAAPCLDHASSPCLPAAKGKWECPVVKNLDVIKEVKANGAQGFKLRLFTNIHTTPLVPLSMRARLFYTQTTEWAQFDRASERLTVSGRVAQSIKRDDKLLVISIPLRNAGVPQSAPSAVTVIGESGLVQRIGLCNDEISPGCLAPDAASSVLTKMSGLVLTSSEEGPMRYSSIRESCKVQGLANILTVELEAETYQGNFTNILAGSNITISGLKGSGTLSTETLEVTGYRLAKHAWWDQEQGTLIAYVNSMPHSQTPAPLKLSFELKNPSAPQAPQVAFVLVSGIGESYGGKSRMLECHTAPGCTGVLAATLAPSFTSVQVFEKTKYTGHVNTLSFFLKGNVPLQRGGTEITVSSLPISVPAGGLELTRSAGTSRRVQRCDGINSCVLRQDQKPVPGTITTRYYTDMTVACTNEDVTSTSFGQDIEDLQIHAVHICGQLIVNAAYQSPCSKVVKQWSVLKDLDVAACQGDDDLLVRIQGVGLMNMTSTLNVHYVMDVSSRLALVNQAIVLTVVTNLSDHAIATQNMHEIAFSFNTTNPTTRRSASNPELAASLPGGVIVNRMQANPKGGGVGGSGVNYCNGVEVISDNTRTSLPFENAGVEAGRTTLGVYHEISHDGMAECIFVIQPYNPKQWLLRFSFQQYDVNEATEMVEMFNGDSPASPRMGILYRQSVSFGFDSKYFLATKDMFMDDCAITFRLLAQRRVEAGQQELLGYAKGRLGFALTFRLVDPTKMDHFKAQLRFIDMVDAVEDVSVQLKLRKVFAAVLDIMYPAVVFEGASSARRSTLLVDLTHDRRAGISSAAYAAIRVLCTDPDATTLQADLFASALNANLVTAAMNDAGIPGAVSLAAPIQVFRCGKELECVPRFIAPEPIFTTPPPPPPPPPAPFPITSVVQLALGIMIGPAFVAVCVLVLFIYYKKKMQADLAAKRMMSIKAFDEWIENKAMELESSDAESLGKLAKKHELVKDGLEEDEIKAMIPEMAKYFYRIENGLGVKPEGIYRYVPKGLYAPAKNEKTGKRSKNKPDKTIVKKVQEENPEVSGQLALEFQEEPHLAIRDENGNPEEETKKKSKKRTEVRKEHKIKWIKRASADTKPETQEEVAV